MDVTKYLKKFVWDLMNQNSGNVTFSMTGAIRGTGLC